MKFCIRGSRGSWFVLKIQKKTNISHLTSKSICNVKIIVIFLISSNDNNQGKFFLLSNQHFLIISMSVKVKSKNHLSLFNWLFSKKYTHCWFRSIKIHHCTEVRFASFLSDGFTTVAKDVHVLFCKRRGAEDFFLMVNLPAVSVFTLYLFWVKTPLSQHRSALLGSKMEIQISHENEWFDNFFFHICDSFY